MPKISATTSAASATALPPAERWRRAQPLPASFSYGSEEEPGRCDGGAGLCPQPGFLNITPENPDAWDEDCFQCNVWTPIGEVPDGGWPVFVFIREYRLLILGYMNFGP
jgi:carboxylesterase type B